MLKEPKRKKKKKDLVTLTVSRKKLAKDTALTSKRHKIGVVAQRDMLANLINVGGGDIRDFSISAKTVRTSGAKAVKEAAVEAKKDFKRVLKEDLAGRKSIIVHFDGKSQAQFRDKIKSVKKRLSIIASSPDLPSEQLLGVPITPSNSGKHQKEVVTEALKDWGVVPHILGLGFDTTSDNTGKNKGAVVLIEKALNEAVWWVACPHHYYEIHIKKVARFYFGESSSPEKTTIKKLKDSWNDIIEKRINYENLELFDWEKWEGTFLADQAREVMEYMKSLLETNTFPREDMRELMNLVLVWLGVKVKKFKFQYPGAMSHARFLMQSIYSVKIFLLSKQLGIYSAEELDQIKNVAICLLDYSTLLGISSVVLLALLPCSTFRLSSRWRS